MIDYLKNLLTGKINDDEIIVQLDNEKRVQISTCALFLEVAHSDDDFSMEDK